MNNSKNNHKEEIIIFIKENVNTNKKVRKPPDNLLNVYKKYLAENKKLKELEIDLIIMLPEFIPNTRGNNFDNIDHIDLYVIGNFMKSYRIIKELSGILTELFWELPVLPLIEPVSYERINESYKKLSIIKKGTLVYEATNI